MGFPNPLAVLTTLHYAYPASVFLYYLVSSAIALCTLQAPSAKHVYRSPVTWLMLAFVLTFPTELLILLVGWFIHGWPRLVHHDVVIGLLSPILVYGIQVAALFGDEAPVWHTYIGSYIVALIVEPLLVTLSFLIGGSKPIQLFDVLALVSIGVRELLVLTILTLYLVGRPRSQPVAGDDAERQPLLNKTNAPAANGTAETYGSVESDGSTETNNSEEATNGNGAKVDTKDSNGKSKSAESPYERRQREAKERMEKRLRENGNWFTYLKSYGIFLPYIWPSDNTGLQIRAVLVGVCLLADNALNVLIPRQMGVLTDSLSGANRENPWVQVLIFALLRLTASEAGLSLLRQWLWLPVENYSTAAMSRASYSHVLNLSSDFHDAKSSSDIMMAIQSGQSLSSLLDSICFHAVPMLIDMALAFVYLSVILGPYEGLITMATSIIFFHIATRMIYKLGPARQGEVAAWFEEHYVRQAGIQGWSTVTCFNQIPHEEQRYSAAVDARVAKSQEVYTGYLVAYAFQYLVLLSGLLAGSLLAVYQVTTGQATAGQFIMLLTYWGQLVSPLNFFAGLGKTISRNLIHAEQLLDIMKTKPTVVSKEGAPPLEFSGGNVRFDHVGFSYDGKKKILSDLHFSVPSGTTVAFVGATGAGKSTILKLLGRFYDVTEGSIMVDGQDIRDVDLCSMREQIGIVPQAPVLFDDTVMNNVRYARLDAADEEVFEACRAACIHDQILSFTDGYSTRVGERGIKISGGELQRLAIARAILKRPSIVLLDEATSSVDTETEQKIQDALAKLCSGRTTFIVAHRLSTVMNAHVIMVVAGGEVVEQGSHEELIGAGGKYAELWSKQVFAKPKPKLSLDLTDAEATPQRKPTTREVDSNGEAVQNGEVRVTVQTPSGHRREGSKLNPDAPTFTPRTAAAAAVASRTAAGKSDSDEGAQPNGATEARQPLREQDVNQDHGDEDGGVQP